MDLHTAVRLTATILGIAILAAGPVVAQQPSNAPHRTVTAPVTVVAPPTAAPEPLIENNAPVRVVQEGPIKVVQSGPVTFTLPLGIWIAWLVSIATGLGAVAVIWRYATKAVTLIKDVSRFFSVLKDIAKEFKSDSGSTLKDSINRIEETCKGAQTTTDKLEKMLIDHIALAKAREEVRVHEDHKT